MMDNRRFDVTTEGRGDLDALMGLVWTRGTQATHFVIRKLREGKDSYEPSEVHALLGTPTLVLLRYQETGAVQLPFPLTTAKMAADFAAGWLEDPSIWREEPDHDGDNGKGFRAFTEAWGHVAGYHSAILAFQPAWAMYGK